MAENTRTKPDIEQTDPEKWDMIISPQRNLFDLRLRELWHARDLIMLFVRRDFVAVYKQTILGPLWYLIQPLLTTIVFTVIFGNIAKLPTDGLPSFLFYMSGTVIFSYFCQQPYPRPQIRLRVMPVCLERFIFPAWLYRCPY